MKLYDSASAPNPRRVRIFLAEKGLEVPRVRVNLGKGRHKEPEFLAKNPLGTIPVLELDDGTCISESVAICRYFEERHPDPPLMGVGPEGRAVVEMWQRRAELEIFVPMALVFRNSHKYYAGRITQVPEYAAACRETTEERLAWLDGVLAEREFIAGDRFSIADITTAVALDFFTPLTRIGVQSGQEGLARWQKAVTARPSFRA